MSKETHLFGPSGAKNKDICPNFIQKNDERPHPVTEEGTRLHEVLESGVFSPELSEYQINLVELCTRYVNSLPQPNVIVIEKRFPTVQGIRPGAIDRVHLKVPSARTDLVSVIAPKKDSPEKGHTNFYIDSTVVTENPIGLLERVKPVAAPITNIIDALEATEADLIDWKFGWNAVDDAENNHQGFLYTLGLFKKFPKLEKVTVHFLQPRINYITTHTFTKQDESWLADFANKLVMRVKAGNEFNVNLSNCIYCDNVTCPAIAEWAQDIAVDYGGLTLPSDLHSSQIDDPEEMDKAYQIAQVVEKWASSVKKHAIMKYHEEGMELPNYEIKFRKGTRKIISAQAAASIMEEYGVPQDDILKVVNLPVTGAEDLVKKHVSKGQKQKKVAELFSRLDDMGALEENGETAYFAKKKATK